MSVSAGDLTLKVPARLLLRRLDPKDMQGRLWDLERLEVGRGIIVGRDTGDKMEIEEVVSLLHYVCIVMCCPA